MLKNKIWLIAACSTCVLSQASAANLMQVYAQAIKNDPVFAKAQATWQAQEMNLPIARASYLPQITALGNSSRNYDFYVPASLSTTHDYNWQYGYSVTLTQPILDLAAWASIKSASAVVKAATATYIAAQQSLMQRTAQAYFEALKAYEALHYVTANKDAILKQYISSRKKYNAGLIAIMDVYDARSRFDQVTAQVISAQNTLNAKLENLRAITGHYYHSLDGFSNDMPLTKPTPASIDAWTKVAVKQNYNIIAQSYNVISAMDKIKQQADGSAPSLDLSGGWNEAQNSDNQNTHTVTEGASLGVNLTYNLLQGGLVYASTKQARYSYVAASDELKLVHRQVVNQARINYRGITTSIRRVAVDRLRIVSANKALVASKGALKVGARTMVDVLNDLTTLYQAEQQFADDRYNYLSNVIDLKAAAGTLTAKNLAAMNHWLTKKVPLGKHD